MSLLFSLFKGYDELRYGLSEKKDGSMDRRDAQSVLNRERYFSTRDLQMNRVVSAGLVHGMNVAIVGESQAGEVISETDALIISSQNLYLAITVADCFPVFIYDPASRIVALVHGGWRGAAGDIAGKAIDALKKNFNTEPETLLVGIGPGIQKCHFEVREDVAEKFQDYSFAMRHEEGSVFIDLDKIIRSQLETAGVVPVHIESSGECTFCLESKYFSYRRDKPEIPDVMIAYIGRGER